MDVTIPVDVMVIVKQLSLLEKLRLVRQLERETWAARLDQVVAGIRTRQSAKKISIQEINQIIEDVRKNRHARTSRRS